MHSALLLFLENDNFSNCIFLTKLSPREQREQFLFRARFAARLSSRLGRLVCALLRFRERPRTIEVQRTTSSPQNHRKSLVQYSVVLFIQSVLFKRFNLRVMIHFASSASISGLMGNGTPRLMSAEKPPSCSYRRRHSSLRTPTRH